MEKATGMINTTIWEFVVVKGMKSKAARRELGLEIADYPENWVSINIGGFNPDVEDANEFRQVHPQCAAIIEGAGISLDGATIVFQIKAA